MGDPCVPEDEYDPGFSGFSADGEVVHTGVWDCPARVCVVDRFQGRKTCPLGQPEPPRCAGPNDASCPGGGECREAGEHLPPCGQAGACEEGLSCNTDTWRCECDGACPEGFSCDPVARACKRYVCHVPGSCQDGTLSGPEGEAENAGKACCVPGTDRPVGGAVCGQCDRAPAEEAIYCSCRCDGPNPCDCPDDFECRLPVSPPSGTGHTPPPGPPEGPRFCFRKSPSPEGPGGADQACGAEAGYHGGECL